MTTTTLTLDYALSHCSFSGWAYYIHDGHETIATVDDTDHKGERYARLFTAAPEMLMALKAAALYKSVIPSGVREQIEAAITKAEGR